MPGGGAGVGLAPKDPQCDLRETARMLTNMGQTIVGYRVLCQTEAMGSVFNRPDHTSRREGRTVPDPEACVEELMRYHGVTLEAYQDMESQLAGMREGFDDLRIQLIEAEENLGRQLARQAAEHEEAMRRCQEELVSCQAK